MSFLSFGRDLSELDEELRIPLDEVEESRMVTEELRAVPSGLKMICKIS